MASAGFTANLQQIPGADFLTDVYIKKQGDALLSEQLTNGADLANTYEAMFEPSGFPANGLGSVNQQLTPLIEQANASLSPSLQGPLMQQIDKTVIQQGLLVPDRLHALDHRLQQESGRRNGRGAHRSVPFGPGRHLHQEVVHLAIGRGRHRPPMHRTDTGSDALDGANGVRQRWLTADVHRPPAASSPSCSSS